MKNDSVLKLTRKAFLNREVIAVMPRMPGKATLLGTLTDDLIKRRKLNKNNRTV